jgi:hypothetical protein
MPNPLLPLLHVPYESINETLDWLKSEQVRIITGDRTSTSRGDKLDWISDAHNSLRLLRDTAEADSRAIHNANNRLMRKDS